MNRLFVQDAYAEDQNNAHNILTLHVIGRGLSSGALLGSVTALLSRVTPYRLNLLKGAAIGSIAGGAGLAIALNGLMTGKDEIEWQDRSWRLLSNDGQNQTDLLTIGGTFAGAVLGAVRKTKLSPSLFWRIAGGASVGNAVGLLAGFATMKPPS